MNYPRVEAKSVRRLTMEALVGGLAGVIPVLFDGWTECPFVPRTLWLEVKPPPDSAPAPSSFATVPGGGMVNIRLSGLQGNAVYRRDFALWLYQSVQIDISNWFNGKVEVLGNSLPNASLVGTFTSEEMHTTVQPVLFLPYVYTATGTFVVPPGALEVCAGVPDAGFSWASTALDTSVVAIPDALPAGGFRSSKGGRFTTTVAPLPLLWRISL